VGTEAQIAHSSFLVLETASLLATREVPKGDNTVIVPNGQCLPIWTQGEITGGFRNFDLVWQSGLQVPDAGRLIAAPRDEESAVGAERDAHDAIGMPKEADTHLAVLQFPDRASNGQRASVWTERQGFNAVTVAPQRLEH